MSKFNSPIFLSVLIVATIGANGCASNPSSASTVPSTKDAQKCSTNEGLGFGVIEGLMLHNISLDSNQRKKAVVVWMKTEAKHQTAVEKFRSEHPDEMAVYEKSLKEWQAEMSISERVVSPRPKLPLPLQVVYSQF